MLIEFRAANFLSIKEPQALSMVAAKNKELADTHAFDAPIASREGLKLLRSAAIFGANAAGKSNLMAAIDAMRDVVVKSASDQVRGDPLPVRPFLLDSKTRNAPSEFEVQFIADGVRYQYGFSATRERVINEWLIAYPHNRAQHWFTREWSVKKRAHQWSFGAFLTGERSLWRGATRDNALFLSTAVQLNSRQLQPVYDWFKTNMMFYNDLTWGGHINSIVEGGNQSKVMNFLKAADFDIDDFQIKEKSFGEDELPDTIPEQTRQAIVKELKGQKIYKITTVHLDSDGKPVSFNLSQESSGTRKMFAFSSFWITALNSERVVFVDDLHEHLHLELLRFLVKIFHKPRSNSMQLVFTSHETALLNQKTMRRDQIWFCRKDKHRATVVYPLTDFHPHKGRENLELGYLSGAYGALPYIREAGV